ncbi:interferon-induced, double-stranded RNA-activated protein kinase-like isoform X2 [Physella acuta]|uniref:interferon-induced, double-stranded RNA-activated protein kinase-like isoform X2 n=1 Tax=Physella acuta TaxID=109671 RepID=UPI0027DC427F|nr:interferon-induced, double-stranded RNA-activated protein kinase-like isoform X2 [Physella acuta]
MANIETDAKAESVQADALPEFTLSSYTSGSRIGQNSFCETNPEMGVEFEKKFEYCDTIGSGSCGEVVRARHKQDKQFYAIKKIKLPKSEKAPSEGKYLREVQSLAKLQHIGIVRYHTVWDEVVNQQPFLFIQMELCQAGTLSTWLADNAGPRPPVKVLPFCKEILEALSYIHGQGIIHRDVKPGNILIANGKLKIGDFGLATCHDDSFEHESHSNQAANQHTALQGTKLYMSPEQLNKGQYDTKVDIFSTGLVFLELCRSFPYPDEENLKERVFNSVRDGGAVNLVGFPEPRMATIVQQMTDKNPAKRPTAKKLLTDMVFKKYSQHNDSSLSWTIINHATNVVNGPGATMVVNNYADDWNKTSRTKEPKRPLSGTRVHSTCEKELLSSAK